MSEWEVDRLVNAFTLYDAKDYDSICDMINQDPQRISPLVANKCEEILKTRKEDPNAQFQILLLLENCVKSCSSHRYFHNAISTDHFIYRMKRTAGTRITDPRNYDTIVKRRNYSSKGHMKTRVQAKVLSLIQSWGPLHPQELQAYSTLYIKLVKKGVSFPPATEEDRAPFNAESFNSPVNRRERRDRLERMPDLSADVTAQFEEIRRTVTVLESVLETIENPEDLCNNEVAQELQTAAFNQKEKLNRDLVELVSKSPDENNDNVVSVMILLLERLELALKNYEMLLTGEKNNDLSKVNPESILREETRGSYETQSSDENSRKYDSSFFDPPEPKEYGKAEWKAPSAPPLFPSHEEHQPQYDLSGGSNPFNGSKTPWDLGMELLQKSSNRTINNPANKDPFLDWLLNGTNRSLHNSSNNNGNPFVSPKNSQARSTNNNNPFSSQQR